MLVVKFLREDYEERVSEDLAENIHRWEAAALDAVSDINTPDVFCSAMRVTSFALFSLLGQYCRLATLAPEYGTSSNLSNVLFQVRGHPNIVDMLGICGASSVSEYYATHLDDVVVSPGAKPLPISSVVRCREQDEKSYV